MRNAGRRMCRDVTWQCREQTMSAFKTRASSGRSADPCAMTFGEKGSEKDMCMGAEEIIMGKRWKSSRMWVEVRLCREDGHVESLAAIATVHGFSRVSVAVRAPTCIRAQSSIALIVVSVDAYEHWDGMRATAFWRF